MKFVGSVFAVLLAIIIPFNSVGTVFAQDQGPADAPAPAPNMAPAPFTTAQAGPAAASPQSPASASSPAGSSAAGDLVGGAQADLFTGAFAAKYPIQVPAGRQGLGPSVALTYNSQAGNGPLGVGWNLQLGVIQRSTQKTLPRYDDSDTFLWSGPQGNGELVRLSGNEYRLKIEGLFQRFVNNGTYWDVWDKSGMRYVYGQPAGSCSQAPAACLDNGRGILQWNLSRVVDTYGNAMTLTYWQDQGQIYPSQIAWTAHEPTGLAPAYNLRFTWQPRPDAAVSYRSGALTVTARRLASLSLSVLGQNVRRYELQYSQSAITGRSMLSPSAQPLRWAGMRSAGSATIRLECFLLRVRVNPCHPVHIVTASCSPKTALVSGRPAAEAAFALAGTSHPSSSAITATELYPCGYGRPDVRGSARRVDGHDHLLGSLKPK